MGLTINEGNDSVSNKITVDRRLWLTADKSELVEDGDPRAAVLWAAAAGREVDAEDAERFGYEPNPKEASDTESVATDAEVEVDEDTEATGENVCPECGFEAKNARGLAAHQRSHEEG